MAWIIGWDLILEYAVGNVAVAISWGDYFNTLLGGVGVDLPAWLTTGYRSALLSANPDVRALLDTAPQVGGVPVLVNVPAFAIVMIITWLLLRGARESSTANNIMVVIKLLALGLFIAVGLMNIEPANYTPFAPNGFTGIHQGAAIVFFAYIGFDAISTAAEETMNPQRNLPIGILGGLAVCTIIYVIVGAVLTGMVPYDQLGVADPLARALELTGYAGVGWIVALGAVVSMSAVLLVFQYGQPRIFFSMARDGLLPSWAAQGRSEDAHPICHDSCHRHRRRSGVAHRRRGRDLRPDEHRDAFRIRAGVRRRPRPARQGAGTSAPVQGAVRVGDRAAWRGGMPLCHGRLAVPGMGTLRHLARHRRRHLRAVRVQAQPAPE